MAAQAKPLTLPNVFLADLPYRIGAVLFCLVGVIGIGLIVGRHQTQDLVAIGLPFLVFFAALLLALTFQLEVDETGLHQKSILGRKDAAWDQVRRLDQGKAYSIYGDTQSELVWLSLVSTAAQLAIAEEAIRRCALKPSGAKLEYPVRQQWIQK
ncbi:MAG: hypothetical protein M3Y13_01250 [Armatimonadota bacterium]|nr:hypothetical protein [Armatimonadota bacterium]